MKGSFWIHADGDSVGVAVEDISVGQDVTGVSMASGKEVRVRSKSDIPLGHKIALREIEKGDRVVEYGEVIGAASMKIRTGDHVHVHNLKTLRWAK